METMGQVYSPARLINSTPPKSPPTVLGKMTFSAAAPIPPFRAAVRDERKFPMIKKGKTYVEYWEKKKVEIFADSTCSLMTYQPVHPCSLILHCQLVISLHPNDKSDIRQCCRCSCCTDLHADLKLHCPLYFKTTFCYTVTNNGACGMCILCSTSSACTHAQSDQELHCLLIHRS